MKNEGPPTQDLETFREFVKLFLRVYLSMDTQIHEFPNENKVLGGEHAESVLGVSSSRDLDWSGLKSKYFGLGKSEYSQKKNRDFA